MNKIVNKFLVAGDKFISEVLLTFYFYISEHSLIFSKMYLLEVSIFCNKLAFFVKDSTFT